VLGAGLYHAYFFICLGRHISKDLPLFQCPKNCLLDGPPFWCDSFAFLIILTALVWAALLYGYVLKPLLGPLLSSSLAPPLSRLTTRVLDLRFTNLILYLTVFGTITAFLVIDCWDHPERLRGAGGFLVLQFLGWVCSVHPGKVRWRHVFWGHSLQFVFALMVLRWNFGRDVVNCLSKKVATFLGYTYAGAEFVFGYAAGPDAASGAYDLFIPGNFKTTNSSVVDVGLVQQVLSDINASGGVLLAPLFFGPLSIIYFVSFCVSMLYYWGALQWVVQKLGWLLYISVGTTAAESMNAAANIFLGQTEAPLLIRPYLPNMTKSEINAVMTGGFATIAGTILGVFIGMGVDAKHLITCSFMAAPTSLAVSKLFYPETEQSKTTINDIKIEAGEEANVLDAAAKGASTAIMLVLNIAASLLAFVAFITFVDGAVEWFAAHAGFIGEEKLTFTKILGYVMWPIAWLIGIETQDCQKIGQLIGEKIMVTELTAFGHLSLMGKAGEISERSFTIATYALCSFANFPSIGIQIGGFGAMAEERKADIASLALRAMVGGCWVSFLNACIAGTLIE